MTIPDSADLLDLPSLRTVGRESAGDHTVVRAAFAHPPVACSHCGSTDFIKHDSVEQVVIDTPLYGRPTKLVLTRRRFLCKACKRTFFEDTEALHRTRAATARLVEFIEQHGLRLSFMEVARQTGIDPKTVRNIVDDYIKVLEAQHPPTTPRCLGIDEVKIGKYYRGVVTNVEANTFVDILERRNKTHLDAYFTAMQDKHKVEVVVTDLWNAYRQMAGTYFPKAEIVADKFHVMRMAVEAVEGIRKYLRQRDLRGKEKEKERLSLKDERHLLLKREANLTPRELAVLDGLRTKYPLLGIAQAAKEQFFAIYDAPDRKTAELMFEAWKRTLDPQVASWFKRLASDVDNWHRHVFTVFDLPYTNAYTESFNRFIKDVNRHGRGHSFPILRARLLYNNRAKIEERIPVRKRQPAVRVPSTGTSPPMHEGFSGPHMIRPQPAPTRQRSEQEYEVRWLGAHIPTLCDMLEEGYFD
jgi:transposase